jgi:hypothetical protein
MSKASKGWMMTKNTTDIAPPKTAQIEISKNATATTSGDGFWSDQKRKVRIKRLVINHLVYAPASSKSEYFGELRAVFSRNDWNVDKHGLIYTDKGWMKDFRSLLQDIGFSENGSNDIEYSEQGMQGDSYVSFDIGERFVREFALIKCFGNKMDKYGRIL